MAGSDRAAAAVRPAPGLPADGFAFRSDLDRRAYEAGVEAIRAAIASGDIYQANLTRRLATPFDGDPWPLYRAPADRRPLAVLGVSGPRSGAAHERA